jgi:hypothetical protein
MSAAAQIRAQIEAALAQRIPSALTPPPRAVRPVIATGIASLDELLDGGLPVGAISEIAGPECSGRTSLALAFLARVSRQGNACAWIDVSDSLHPESAAAAGVDLGRLLWVRCGNACAETANHAIETPPVEPPQTARVQLGGNSPHPRSEANGLPSAIGDLLAVNARYKRDRITGTPGAPNRPLSTAGPAKSSREEQVGSDRQPARRGSFVLEQREAYEPRCAESQRKPRPQAKYVRPVTLPGNKRTPDIARTGPLSRLDQALRVTDLLLQAGGFRAIVLDMGGIAAEFATRVPLATWFRYRAAAERTQASLLLLTQHACAKSSAGALLRLDAAQPLEEGATVFAGLGNHLELARQRFERETAKIVPIKKAPQRALGAEWTSKTAWAGLR